MLIELSQLPKAMQQHNLNKNTDVVQIVNHGQVITTMQFGKYDDELYFDIEQMQAMMDSDVQELSKFKNDDEFLAWVNAI